MARLAAPSLSRLPALSKSSTDEGSSALSYGPFTPDDIDLPISSDDDFFTDRSVGTKKHLAAPPPLIVASELLLADSASEFSQHRLKPLSRAVAKVNRIAGETLGRRKRKDRANLAEKMSELGEAVQRVDVTDNEKAPAARRSSPISIHLTHDVVSDAEAAEADYEASASESNSDTDLPPKISRSVSANFFTELDLGDDLPVGGMGTFSSFSSYFNIPAESEPWTARRIFLTLVRILFFLPWCVAVGGTILLAPSYLEHVAFAPGYMRSERGPRRFAYWADCAIPHTVIFATCVGALVWWHARSGVPVATAVLARFVYAWHDFRVDLTVPLGADDRQSIYLVVTKMYLRDDFVMTVPMGLRADN